LWNLPHFTAFEYFVRYFTQPISVYNQPARSTQPDHSFWLSGMSISEKAVMFCGWGVKEGMVGVRWQV